MAFTSLQMEDTISWEVCKMWMSCCLVLSQLLGLHHYNRPRRAYHNRLLRQMAADKIRYIKYTQKYKDRKADMHDKMRD